MAEPAVTFVDTQVHVPGGTVFVRTWSPSTAWFKIPIVLLHDSLGCVELWRDFPEKLVQELRRPVVAYDRLGFGRSSERKEPPGPNFIDEEADQVLPALRDQLGWSDFILFGHSVGGEMALVTSARMGLVCKAVISESAQAFVEPRTLAAIRAARAGFENPEKFAKLQNYHGSKARWVLDAWTETWLSPAFAAWSLAADLPLVKCPVLVIHGDLDEFGSIEFPKFIGKHAGGPTELHILERCGHVPHREQPEKIVRLVDEFVKNRWA